MNRFKGLFIFGAGALATAAMVTSGGGCSSTVDNSGSGGSGSGASQASGNSTPTATTGAPTTGSTASGVGAGSGQTATNAMASTGAISNTTTESSATVGAAAGGSTSGTGGKGSGSSSSGTGGGTGCTADMDVASLVDINNGAVAAGVKVHMTGLVAMSPKFLVSASKSGSCLWGVYLSDPGLTTTAPYTGILAVSYGSDAVVSGDAGKAYCPVPPTMPAGDAFPDDIKPGDVVDILGKATAYAPTGCSAEPQVQLSNVCKVTKTGTAAVPAPADLSMNVADLGAPGVVGNNSFHNQWGGALVKITKVQAVEQMSPHCAGSGEGGGTTACVTDQYGTITLKQSVLSVEDVGFYQGYLVSTGTPMDAICHSAVEYVDPNQAFKFIVGFSTLDYCTWSIQPDDKCADFGPPSADCLAARITSCN